MKGMFTQSAYIFGNRAPSARDLQDALRDFEILGGLDKPEDGHWAFGNASLLLQMEYQEEGRLTIDVCNRPWPDDLGTKDEEEGTIAAWQLGFFGPAVFPGSMVRAAQQAWAWKQAPGVAGGHRAFIRVRSGYVRDADDEGGLDGYDPVQELIEVTKVAAALLEMQGMLCYFNPNGETLRPLDFIEQSLEWFEEDEQLPLDVWCNVRIAKVDAETDWRLMDCVGMAQLDLPDIEVAFRSGKLEFGDADAFIRQLATYIYSSETPIKDGETIDGPGETNWKALFFSQGFTSPPRKVLRFLPTNEEEVPLKLTDPVKAREIAEAEMEALREEMRQREEAGETADSAFAIGSKEPVAAEITAEITDEVDADAPESTED